jgi:hypothetical protein
MKTTGVIPHAVLSGHVHNYQRFTRRYEGRQIPHVVDGRGGYANTFKAMHKLQKDASGNYPAPGVRTQSEQDPELDLTLDAYDQDNPGFLKIMVTATELTIESYTVPFEGSFTNAPEDSVSVSMAGVITNPPPRRGAARTRGRRRR